MSTKPGRKGGQQSRIPTLFSENESLLVAESKGNQALWSPAKDEQEFAHDQEDQPKKPEIPGKAIALSVSLLCCGITLLTLGLLHLRGHIFSKDGAGWGFTTLGLLTFLPGFYMSRIAYYTLRGTPGFDYSAIPNL